MRTDGSGEGFDRKLLSGSSFLVTKRKSTNFTERPNRLEVRVFSETVVYCLTGYNERLVDTKLTLRPILVVFIK